MSPTSSHHRQPVAAAGTGVARHAAASFKVHRDSHSIHKAATSSPLSSSSTNSSVSSSSNAAAIITTTSSGGRHQYHHHRPAAPPPPQPPPVIIYTHSPEVIRANPGNFMSIVQRFTGLNGAAGHHHRHGGRDGAPLAPGQGSGSGSVVAAPQDESPSSSSESCANTYAAGPPPPPPYADLQFMPPPPLPLLDAHFMAPDLPLLFAPDGGDAAASDLQHLCAPGALYCQFPPVDAAARIIGGGPVMSSANMMSSAASDGGAVFSPSMVETMRTFSGYNY